MPIPAIAAQTAMPTTAGLLQLADPAGMGASALKTSAGSLGFQQMFADAVSKTNGLQQAADLKQRQLVAGEVENIHDVMIAMEKASLAFSLTLQVRNKVIEAYQEVMRMQI